MSVPKGGRRLKGRGNIKYRVIDHRLQYGAPGLFDGEWTLLPIFLIPYASDEKHRFLNHTAILIEELCFGYR